MMKRMYINFPWKISTLKLFLQNIRTSEANSRCHFLAKVWLENLYFFLRDAGLILTGFFWWVLIYLHVLPDECGVLMWGFYLISVAVELAFAAHRQSKLSSFYNDRFLQGKDLRLIPLVWLPKNNMVEVRQDEVRQEELVENTTLTFLLKEIILVVNWGRK